MRNFLFYTLNSIYEVIKNRQMIKSIFVFKIFKIFYYSHDKLQILATSFIILRLLNSNLIKSIKMFPYFYSKHAQNIQKMLLQI